MARRIVKYYWLKLKRVFKRLARSAGSPRQIALGAAIGMVVGMTPTVGLQMLLCVPFCLLFRANILAAAPIVWITNPATMVPIYSFNYWIGTLFVRSGPRLGEFAKAIGDVIAVSEKFGVWAGVRKLADIGWEIQLPLWTGCFIVGFTLAVPTYYLFFHAVVKIRRNIEERRAKRRERLHAAKQFLLRQLGKAGDAPSAAENLSAAPEAGETGARAAAGLTKKADI